jgi:glycosyltransferase involved in cell wall biosynthesis
VPVHNVREYLPDCLDSIVAQTYRNIEIIVIDDGSTDGGETLCNLYAGRDSRITVVHQKQQGLSGARNTGLTVACCVANATKTPERLNTRGRRG